MHGVKSVFEQGVGDRSAGPWSGSRPHKILVGAG